MKWRDDTIELEEIGKETFKLNNHQQLRKNKKGDYRIIYPLKVNERILWGNVFKINWTVLILLIAILLILYNYNMNMQECQEIVNNPDDFCDSIKSSYGGFRIEDATGEEYTKNSLGLIK